MHNLFSLLITGDKNREKNFASKKAQKKRIVTKRGASVDHLEEQLEKLLLFIICFFRLITCVARDQNQNKYRYAINKTIHIKKNTILILFEFTGITIYTYRILI